MTEKGRVLHYLRNLSSGTLAGIVGSTKYAVLDRAASNALLYASRVLTEEECGAVRTMEDYTNLVLAAQGRTDI